MKVTCDRCATEYPPDAAGIGDACPACAFHPRGDPRRFGPYRIVRIVGRGALGVVFRARRGEHGSVALKVLVHSDPVQAATFEREGAISARFSHPNIVGVRDRGVAESRPYIAYEFVAGPTLAAEIAKGPLDPDACARLGATVARTLLHVHRLGVIHSDITPSNILITPDGSPKITDFGLAAEPASGSHLPAGTTAGTPVYMSPEQAAGLHDLAGPRSDVYSLGAVLHHAASGRAPFAGRRTLDILRRVQEEEPAPLTGVDARLAAVLGKAMQKDPAKRHPSMKELAEDLDRWNA